MRTRAGSRQGVAMAVLIATAGGATSASAQQAERLPAGVQVRATLRTPPPQRVVGIVSSDDGNTLVITEPDGSRPEVLRRADLTKLERLVGTRSRHDAMEQGASRGLKVGIVTGLVTLAGFHAMSRGEDGGDWANLAAAAITIPVTVVGVLFGLADGAGSTDLYDTVPLVADGQERSHD